MYIIQSAAENIRTLDIFGMDVHLLSQRSNTHKTYSGAAASIFILSVLVYSFYSFILQMNEGKNAILNRQEALLQNNEGYTFDAKDFIFITGLLDGAGQPIMNQNNSIYSVTFYFCNKSLSDTQCTYFSSTICGDIITELSQVKAVQSVLENGSTALTKRRQRTFTTVRLQGSQRMDNFTLFGVLLNRCVNSTEKNDCASQEQIDQLVTNSNFYYSYTNFQFRKDLNSYPFETMQNFDVTTLYPKLKKYIKVLYSYSVAYLEYNPFYFFPQTTECQSIEYDQSIIDAVVISENDAQLAQVELHLGVKKFISQVTYQTLMDVAAKLGGFFTILKICISIILQPIQWFQYRLYLINRYLDIKKGNRSLTNLIDIDNLNFLQVVFSKNKRKYFYEQNRVIDKLLDIAEIAFNPLKLIRQVEDLQFSIKQLDISKTKRYRLEENEHEQIEIKSICRSINQELDSNGQQKILPSIKINITSK
ncbi:unnamed protein product (macronuclear) [Paramecium tetraurelia]|uniref:Transmembrane protein n=1 Tax=Paramecium tetraurelia TaxID=5888 RepID=A0CDW1_PARTE|nr:uncharacterized protein GSPATT00007190001 [Paramecium tetraurelia]CAK68978.1 unnamed protein product [Paramecium tetraurelia]|eukprot:XP_001436375.1 hypothetical protein (macronuclear) [Paramecium tetraurelia strain d4-2]